MRYNISKKNLTKRDLSKNNLKEIINYIIKNIIPNLNDNDISIWFSSRSGIKYEIYINNSCIKIDNAYIFSVKANELVDGKIITKTYKIDNIPFDNEMLSKTFELIEDEIKYCPTEYMYQLCVNWKSIKKEILRKSRKIKRERHLIESFKV